jgi:putative membrane-bound dehydrogenase-like protein
MSLSMRVPLKLTLSGFTLFGLLLLAASVLAQKTPDEELKSLRPAAGLDVGLFASEPMITNPSCLDVDSHGRVWVAEIQFYRAKAKNPPADKIKVLEDTDGDGKADKMTVFADGLFAPMSICVCGNKVYSFISGELCVFTDADGDLKADGPPEKILKGFSNANHDHTAHSMVIGPDHKWYMAHGDTGFKVEGTDGSKIEYKWGAMIRGELDGSKLEVYAHNFRNPYEICVDSFGNAYCTDNDNDGNQSTRATWILEGGNYGWYGGPAIKKEQLDTVVPKGTPFREHWHFRGYIPGNVPATIMTGFGSPCGMCVYEGDLFGETFRNMPLHCDPGPREVRKYPHELAGFGMKGKLEAWLTTQGDNYFRPDDICVAPDGSLLISDWYDGGVGGHGYNDPDRGRIFRVTPTGKKATSPTKGGPYKTLEEAFAALNSPNLATQFEARERILLGKEDVSQKLDKLTAAGVKYGENNPNYEARYMWLCDRLGEKGRSFVAGELKSNGIAGSPEMRALAVRILRRHPDYLNKILPLANDSSPEVQREVLLACRNVKKDDKLAPEVLKTILAVASKFDGIDRYMLETINIAAGEQKAELAKALIENKDFKPAQFPLVQLLDPKLAGEMFAAKLADPKTDAVVAKDLVETAALMPNVDAGRSLAAVIANDKSAVAVRNAALGVIAGNIEGPWAELQKDAKLRETVTNLLKKDQKPFHAAALQLVSNAGWAQATPALLALASDPDVNAEVRLNAIATAVNLRGDQLTEGLRKILAASDGPIRTRVLAALVDLQDLKTIRAVLTDAKTLPAERNEMIVGALKSSGGALGLLKLLDDKSFAPELAKLIVTEAAKHPDSNVRILYEKFLPAEAKPKKLGDAIKAEEILALKGDLKRGEKIFMQSNSAQCKSCHVVENVGVNIGPELSLIGKKYERAALLETILLPSKAISHGYEAYLVETVQGQTYLGFLVEDNDKQVVLRDQKGQLIRVPKGDVETLQKQTVSLMPELVLKDVTAQDAADLLAYLSSLTRQVHPVSEFRILGPLDDDKAGFDKKYALENKPGEIDWKQEHDGVAGKIKWDTVKSDGKLGFAGIDTNVYDKKVKARSESVAHYAAVVVESLTDQPAELLVSADDACKIWVNGTEIFKHQAGQKLSWGAQRTPCELHRGKNVILMKVTNGTGPGGFSLGVKCPDPVVLKTE